MQTINGLSVRPTRFPELGYTQQDRSTWRFVSLQDGICNVVGQQYRTKAELLADLERYATEVWGY